MPAHIRQRGNNRCLCFADDRDRLLYLALLAEAAATEQCSVHAYVLMTNHVHILASAQGDHALSGMMKRVGEKYVRSFNKKHSRTGTLWEGRFSSSIVDTQAYLLTCYRYIESNPVRAGMVATPGDYPWSSFAHNAGVRPSALVRPHPVYLALGGTAAERFEAYRALFTRAEARADLDLIRGCINSGLALGDAEFVRRIEQESGRPASRKPGGRPRRKERSEDVSQADNFGLTPVLGSV